MTGEELKTKIFGMTENGERYTFRQWLVGVWFALSIAFTCMVEEAPIWFYGLMLANIYFASRKLEKLPLPRIPEDELEDDEA